jgi:hypothetical protein
MHIFLMQALVQYHDTHQIYMLVGGWTKQQEECDYCLKQTLAMSIQQAWNKKEAIMKLN